MIAEEEKRIGIALFGLGRAGHIHASNLRSNRRVNLRWIVEDDVEKAKMFAKENYLDIQVVSSKDIEKVLKDDGLHACIICTPTFTHEDYVLRSLRAGKAVFCEKPIATTLAATCKYFTWNIFQLFLLTYFKDDGEGEMGWKGGRKIFWCLKF